jgi:hypothetical protein
VAKGGIEPPTRGFSILPKKQLHALIAVDTIHTKSIRINSLVDFLPRGVLIRIRQVSDFSLTSVVTS